MLPSSAVSTSTSVASATVHDSSDLREFCTSRSEAAFTALVRRHLPLVYHAALRRLGSAALAEEAAQNAFSRLALKASAVARHPERLRAWLHRTAYLEACTLARKEARLSRLPAPADTPAFTPMNRPEMYDRLDEALSALPELDRELLLRRCSEGEDFRRIAAAVGKSETACQKRVERALGRLGRRLGGAGAAGPATAVAVLAGMAGAGPRAKAAAASIPLSASRVAAAALRKETAAQAAGSWWGLTSGVAVTAGVMAALAGGAVGWSQASASLALNPGAPKPPSFSAPPSGPALSATALKDAPERRARSLEEVLESIQAGRLGALIDFLPTATPADLQAVLAEDNLVYMGEGSPPPTEARQLALRHWAAIDPRGAFTWAQWRDSLTGGSIAPDSALVLAEWMRTDSAAALAAFASLSPPGRGPLASALVEIDDEAAGRLLDSHPEIFAAVTNARGWSRESIHSGPSAEQEKIIDRVLSGSVDPTVPESEIQAAFRLAAFKDSDLRMDQISRIPDPDLRNRVKASLLSGYATIISAEKLEELRAELPPSLMRSRLTALLGRKIAEADPGEAFRWLEAAPAGLERDAYYHQAASVLADVDPWRLLELTASMKGSIGSTESILGGGTKEASGRNNHEYFYGLAGENTLDRLLTFAGADDPARALRLVPQIAEKQQGRYDLMPLHHMVAQVLSGWVEKDVPAAIRWAAASGTDQIRDELWRELPVKAEVSESLITMLDQATETERGLIRRVLQPAVEAALKAGTAQDLLGRLPPRDADEITSQLSGWASARGQFPEALRLAELVSPDARLRDVLPGIADDWLKSDAPAALQWMRALPETERRAVSEHSEALTPEQRAALQ